MIWWHGDVVTIGKIFVDILEYKIFLQKQLDETEKILEERVLQGLFNLHELDNICNISKPQELSQAEMFSGMESSWIFKTEVLIAQNPLNFSSKCCRVEN